MNKHVDAIKKQLKTRDGQIKVAIAGVVVVAAVTSEYTGFDHHELIKVTPEVLKVLDDGNKFRDLFKPSGGPAPNPLWLMDLNNPNEKDRLVTFQSFDPGKASPSTLSYLKHRRMKKWGSSAVSLGGILSSSHTAGVNVFGAGKEGNAVGVTLKHIGVIQTIGQEHHNNLTVQEWVEQIVKLKQYKLGIRATKFLGSVIPHSSVITTLVTEFQKLGVDLYYKTICDTIATDIHYTAFVEMIYKNGEGPASDIVRELFTRRGALAVLGRYDPNAYIREPGGWKAISDKIAMI